MFLFFLKRHGDEMRGIVTAPEMGLSTDRDVIIPVTLHPFELRRCLLYWDQVAVAYLAGPETGTKLEGNVKLGNLRANTTADRKVVRQDIDELARASILKEYTVTISPAALQAPAEDSESGINMFGFRGSQINEAAIAAKTLLTEHLNNESMYDSIWAFGHAGHSLMLPPSVGEPVDNLMIDILDRLPVPKEDTPIADILTFRSNRRPELLQFRAAIQDLGHAITESPDNRAEVVAAIESVERVLVTLDRLLAESAMSRLLSGLAVLLRSPRSPLLDVLSAVAAALGVQQGTPASIALGAGLGVAGIGLNTVISLARTPCLRLPQDCRDFAYLYHAKRRWS